MFLCLFAGFYVNVKKEERCNYCSSRVFWGIHNVVLHECVFFFSGKFCTCETLPYLVVVWGENLFTSGVCNSLIGLQRGKVAWKMMWDVKKQLRPYIWTYSFVTKITQWAILENKRAQKAASLSLFAWEKWHRNVVSFPVVYILTFEFL